MELASLSHLTEVERLLPFELQGGEYTSTVLQVLLRGVTSPTSTSLCLSPVEGASHRRSVREGLAKPSAAPP